MKIFQAREISIFMLFFPSAPTLRIFPSLSLFQPKPLVSRREKWRE